MSTKLALFFLVCLVLTVLHPVAVEPRNPVCNLPPKTGRCRAYFKRFYYDPRTNSCLNFVYGGCDSNGNNFQSKVACERACKS